MNETHSICIKARYAQVFYAATTGTDKWMNSTRLLREHPTLWISCNALKSNMLQVFYATSLEIAKDDFVETLRETPTLRISCEALKPKHAPEFFIPK
jgi:hypothetical protein